MKINVNGEEKKIELDQENALLSTALHHMGYKPNTIVVELNNLIINSMKWEKVKLKDLLPLRIKPGTICVRDRCGDHFTMKN